MSREKINCVLLPGLITSIHPHFHEIIKNVDKSTRIIICTEECSEKNLDFAFSRNNTYIHVFKKNDNYSIRQSKLPTKRLYQWYKLERCFHILRRMENKHELKTMNIFKLRPDYYYKNPDVMIQKINTLEELPFDTIYADSDRVFFGERDSMLETRHFQTVARALFANKTEYYYPINYEQLSVSDISSTRWERLNLDRRIINFENINEILATTSEYFKSHSYQEIADKLKNPPTQDQVYSFHTGNKEFASERSFAWYLNILGIRTLRHKAVYGYIEKNG